MTKQGGTMLDEFKAFAMKGNLIDIAVGLILALAFSAVVSTFVDGILLSLIAAVIGEQSFDAIVWTIGSAPDVTEVRIGSFITALVTFVIVAWVLFLIVKATNRFRRPDVAGPTEIELLTEIRDSLRERPG
jgi:large conductance mechanosensitive channel